MDRFNEAQAKSYWRDCLGIEPSGDGTRLPGGFEDRGEHQCRSQPQGTASIIQAKEGACKSTDRADFSSESHGLFTDKLFDTKYNKAIMTDLGAVNDGFYS